MASRDRPPQADGEGARATWRLGVAAIERSRLRDAHKAAKGTARELETNSSLRAADDQVRARERWLQSVDDHHY
jgi:hypothetical protein